MKSAHQPVSLAVRGRLSPQFRSDSRCAFRIPNAFTGPPNFRKSPDRPLSLASVSPVECLPATHYPLLTTHSPLTTFRINTCKSVSKQSTLTTFRMNTYEKRGEGGTPPAHYPTTYGSLPTLPMFAIQVMPSYAQRGASIPCGLCRLRILPVASGVYPLRSSDSSALCLPNMGRQIARPAFGYNSLCSASAAVGEGATRPPCGFPERSREVF
jgi:hypothetical protein